MHLFFSGVGRRNDASDTSMLLCGIAVLVLGGGVCMISQKLHIIREKLHRLEIWSMVFSYFYVAKDMSS